MRKIRVALTPRWMMLKTKLSNGAFICGKNLAGFGGRGIYIFRDSIEPEFEHLEKFLDTTGVFIDVGANSGMYTLKAAKHYSNDKGIVLAIEPFHEMISTLFHNVKLNNLTNIRIRNFCAGSHTGSSTLWLNFNKPNTFSLNKLDENAAPFSSLTVALDDLFEWEKLERLDYIKIDVEGSEKDVLKGSEKIIQKYRPIIQVEVIANDVSVELPDYSIFKAPQSLNKIYIPNESNKINIPEQLGWEEITNQNISIDS